MKNVNRPGLHWNLFLLTSSLFFCLTAFCLLPETTEIKGVVTDQTTKQALPHVLVSLKNSENKVIAKTSTATDGLFSFKNIQTGIYSCEAYLAGYQKIVKQGIRVSGTSVTNITLSMTPVARSLEQVQIKTIQPDSKNKYVITDQLNEQQEILPAIEHSRNHYRLSEPSGGATCKEIAVGQYNREGYDHLPENEFHPALEVPLSTFSIDVDRASYANVRRFISQGSMPPVDAVRIEEMINYFNYDYPQPDNGHPFSINTEIIPCPWNREHQLALIGLQGKKIQLTRLPASNLVFLIDVSGSMNSPDKLPLVKRSLNLLVNELREKDRVALVVYAGNAGLVLPSTSGNEKEKIIQAINRLEAGGSTAGGAGINLAYQTALENHLEDGNNRVILCTDGDFNVGVSSDGELVRLIEEKRKQDVFLTVLGFGTGNYQDAKMEKLADKGNGNYAYIDNIMEAKKTLVNELGGTLLTIAKDVKLQVEFNPTQVMEYKLIGYENRLLQDRDFNDDTKDAGELGSGHTVTALYELIPANGNPTGGSVDPLKYQLKNLNDAPSMKQDLFTVKFRYKNPREDSSKLMVHVVTKRNSTIETAGENIRFASSVAAFGLMLRNSKFKGTTDYDLILKLANGARGEDRDGYRGEFIRLVETARVLSKNTASE